METTPEDKKKSYNKTYQRIYYKKNSKDILSAHKEYKKRNADSIKEKNREYYEKNKKDISDKNRERAKNRRCIDPNFKYLTNLRNRLGRMFKLQNIKKTKHTKTLIGCTPEYLKEYLSAQFKEGMSHENYGYRGWHIDHIIPLSSAGSDKKRAEELCHYTNLQPLWWWENVAKADSV